MSIIPECGSIVVLILLSCANFARQTSNEANLPVIDPKGYIVFCPCMGRFGNQAEHYLGSLVFAKRVDRTLLLPPWRTWKNIRFDEWYKVEAVQEYHRVMLAEDFMDRIAPKVWPKGSRYGFCFSINKEPCQMKNGNPFTPFWDELGVDFDKIIPYNLGYQHKRIEEEWQKAFPPSEYPVIALRGAPASYPMEKETIPLHRLLQWSDKLMSEATEYIKKTFKNQSFVGIHLRNDHDWNNVCNRNFERNYAYMSSYQCDITKIAGKENSSNICLPSNEEIIRKTREVVKLVDAKFVYVATDRDPHTVELQAALKDLAVKVVHEKPSLPQIDLIILGQSTYFIGNCISSFSAYVTRERLVTQKPTTYFGTSYATNDIVMKDKIEL